MIDAKRSSARAGTSQALLFCLVGGINTLVDIAVFFVLYRWCRLDSLLSQSISYLCGAANSFLLNRFVTFSKRGQVAWHEIIRFAAVNASSWLASILILYGCTHLLHISVVYGKAAATIGTLGINYTGSKLWVFSTRQISDDPVNLL